MTAAINAADSGIRDAGAAAKAAEAMADGLNSHGFDVSSPASEGCCYLKVTNHRATLADLTIYPNQTVDWEYFTELRNDHGFQGAGGCPDAWCTVLASN